LKDTLGEKHEKTLCAAFKFAKVLDKGKRYDPALRWYRYVYLTELELFGERSLKVLEVRNAISHVLGVLGMYEDSSRWRAKSGAGCIRVR
jgi:hypothetical protein